MVLAQLSLGISTGSREGFSLGGDFNDEGLIIELSLDFGLSTFFKGLFEGLFNFNEFTNNVVELFS